jgi:hypothetical protein
MKVLQLIIIVGVFFIFGCTNAGDLYIQANRQAAEVMLPDLLEYIQGDGTLSEEEKEIRMKAVEEWLNLIREKMVELGVIE